MFQLVRRMTRGILRCGQRVEWSPQSLAAISSSVGALLKEVNGLGLQMHLADLWMEEVAKVNHNNSISHSVTKEMSQPFNGVDTLCYDDTSARLYYTIDIIFYYGAVLLRLAQKGLISY